MRIGRGSLPRQVDFFPAQLGEIVAGEAVGGIAIFAAVHSRHGKGDAFAGLEIERLAQALVERRVGGDRRRAVREHAEEVGHSTQLGVDGAQRGLRTFRGGGNFGNGDARHDDILLPVSLSAGAHAPVGMGFSTRLWLKASNRACSPAPGLSRMARMPSTITSGASVASATRVCSMKSGSGIARGSPLL